MKKFVELKTVEKGNVLVNVNHIVSIESLTDDTLRILLVGSSKDSSMLYYNEVATLFLKSTGGCFLDS